MKPFEPIQFDCWMKENEDLIPEIREQLCRECPRCEGHGNTCPQCGCDCSYECIVCDGDGKFLSPELVPDDLVRDAMYARYTEQLKRDRDRLRSWQQLIESERVAS